LPLVAGTIHHAQLNNALMRAVPALLLPRHAQAACLQQRRARLFGTLKKDLGSAPPLFRLFEGGAYAERNSAE
jgi:hypothetical protein